MWCCRCYRIWYNLFISICIYLCCCWCCRVCYTLVISIFIYLRWSRWYTIWCSLFTFIFIFLWLYRCYTAWHSLFIFIFIYLRWLWIVFIGWCLVMLNGFDPHYQQSFSYFNKSPTTHCNDTTLRTSEI